MVGPGGLKDLLQPKRFCDCVSILKSLTKGSFCPASTELFDPRVLQAPESQPAKCQRKEQQGRHGAGNGRVRGSLEAHHPQPVLQAAPGPAAGGHEQSPPTEGWARYPSLDSV